jgi:CHAD domain-containing protein
VREVLGKTWKKADKLGRNLRKLDAEHRHEMRKALKKLRYQAEFFVPLFGKRDSERFIERLKTLQDVFGYVHSCAARAASTPALLCFCSATICGASAHRCRRPSRSTGRTCVASTGEAWDHLNGARRFWD